MKFILLTSVTIEIRMKDILLLIFCLLCTFLTYGQNKDIEILYKKNRYIASQTESLFFRCIGSCDEKRKPIGWFSYSTNKVVAHCNGGGGSSGQPNIEAALQWVVDNCLEAKTSDVTNEEKRRYYGGIDEQIDSITRRLSIRYSEDRIRDASEYGRPTVFLCEGRAKLLKEKAILTWRKSRIDSEYLMMSIEIMQEALKYAELADNDKLSAEILIALGNLAKQINNPLLAYNLYTKAADKAKRKDFDTYFDAQINRYTLCCSKTKERHRDFILSFPDTIINTCCKENLLNLADEAAERRYEEKEFLAYAQLYSLSRHYNKYYKYTGEKHSEKAVQTAIKLLQSDLNSQYLLLAIDYILGYYREQFDSKDHHEVLNAINELSNLEPDIYAAASVKHIYTHAIILGMTRATSRVQVEKAIHNLDRALLFGRGLEEFSVEKAKEIFLVQIELHAYQGNYKVAKELILQVLTDDPYAKSNVDYYTALGNIEEELGNYSDALIAYQKAEDIALTNKEKNSLPTILYNKSFVFKNIGNYRKAEELLLKSLNYLGAQLYSISGIEEDHPIPAIDSASFMSYYLEKDLQFIASAITVAPHNSNTYYRLLSLIELCYSELGEISLAENNFDKAKENFHKAAKWMQRSIGQYHIGSNKIYGSPGTTISLIKLSFLTSDTIAAKEYFNHYHKFEDSDLSASRPNLKCQFLLLEAKHLLFENKYEEAEKKGIEALKMAEDFRLSTDVVETLHFLANLNDHLGKQEKSFDYYRKLIRELELFVVHVFPGMSENDKFNFVAKIKYYLNDFYSVSLNQKNISVSDGSLIFDSHLFYNKLIVGNLVNLRGHFLRSRDTALLEMYDNWVSKKKYLAKVHSLGSDEIFRRGISLESIQDSIDILERMLTHKSGEFANSVDTTSSWRAIKDRLKDHEAAIEFIDVKYTSKGNYDSILYYALVLHPACETPIMVRLFKETELDKIMRRSARMHDYKYVKYLYGWSEEKSMPNSNALHRGSLLYKTVWLPLESSLKNVKTIYLSPSGILNKISYAAIPISDSTFLSDRYDINYVSSTKEIESGKQTLSVMDKNTSIAIYGGISYQLDSLKLAQLAKKNSMSIDEDLLARGTSIPNDTSRNSAVYYLPGTLKEANAIQELFKMNQVASTKLTHENATEESFKRFSTSNSPRIIHLATHGFFFPERENKELSISGSSSTLRLDNPLFRSGLLLAGANRVWTGKDAFPGVEDGILTAYEVSNTILKNTELVVMSACQTGIGDIKESEGVYGLQRAFKIAGVNHAIMTLWSIADAETMEFMELFYSNLIIGNDIRSSFKFAQEAMKLKYDPFYWGAFVLIR